MAKFLKDLMVNELKELAGEAESCVLVDVRGLTAKEADELRRILREKGVRMNVVPNRLYRRALEERFGPEAAQDSALRELFRGPTAVVFGSDGAVTAAKVLLGWRKEHEKLTIKGGLLDRRPIDAAGVEELSKLPSKETLIAGVAAAVVDPLTSLMWFLEGAARNLAYAVAAVAEKKEKEGGA